MRKIKFFTSLKFNNFKMKKYLFAIFLISMLFSLGFVSSATFTNIVSNCSAEDNAVKGSFAGACDNTTGSFLTHNDSLLETHTYQKSNYGGIRIQSVNTSITTCGSVTQVFICYKWWRTATATAQDCDISVDANGGASYTIINSTCPGTTEPASVSCQNVTANETWTCANFFGASGTRAFAKSELTRVTSGGVTTEIGTWNVMYFNVTYTANTAPVINNITASNTTIKGGDIITIYANTSNHGVNDSNADTLYLYCDSSTTPNVTNTDCTGGTLSDSTYPYALTCTFPTLLTNTNYTEFCRIYDGNAYSSTVPNITYTTDSNPPTTSIISVAGDTTVSYFDTANNGRTDILVSGETNMLCRWSNSDVVYSSMSNDCTISETQANCSVNDVASQGFTTRYVSCKDSFGNEQNITQNLNVQFYLDYTAPTTSDNSVSSLQVPNYTITLIEADNVDSDPKSYYCTSTSQGCNPTTSVNNGSQIIYTSSDRGVNYLRYYSVDFAGNIQTIVNKTININQLPVFISATDNSTIIKGGATVNVSTVIYDGDSSQTLTLFVCSSSGASLSGCSGTEYCSTSGTTNSSCVFASENDSATHTWYAYIFDQLGEAATANPLMGNYITDSTSPTIILANPLNNTNLTQNSVTFTIVVNEALTNSWYSLNSGVNNVTLANVSLYVYTHSNTSIANENYNLSIWANDSYGNIGSLFGNSFTISGGTGDTTKPIITIRSPVNASYYSSASVLLNITGDEILEWAGYINNSNLLTTLDNVSSTNWNTTITLTEGQHNITFYANDTSHNQANKSIVIYVDLANPQVSSFLCTNPVNDSKDINCSASVSDTVGLSYAIIGNNATGSWQNSSQISLAGISANLSYIISAGNTTPPRFTAEIYLFDLSGRSNLTTNYQINVSDDTFPEIYNITYSPNTTAELDPSVRINVNATIVEDYKISEVVLMWQNLSDGNWIAVTMTNNSAIANGSSATVIYNASFIPGNGTYSFKINSTDLAGNMNISNSITINVANESSFWNETDIPAIKSFTYAQRIDNNTLGIIYLNNTGDSNLNFNLSISALSPLAGKFNINYTNDDNASYSIPSGENLSLSLFINTTGITTGLYSYNITIISEAGTMIYEKKVYVQTAEGPYLQILIDTYSSSVTTSQTGVAYDVSVINLGTQDAYEVNLTWTLPSIFTLTSGILTKSLSNLPIGISKTNPIIVNVGSSTSDVIYYIDATAAASNANSVNASKAITVSNPITITQTVTTTGAGGGGSSGGGGSAQAIVYSKTIEIVRGEQDSFDIEVSNKNYNSSLQDLTLNITGFLPQYITISPSKISRVNPRSTEKFNVKLKIPSYKESYEEYTLKAVISGYKIDGVEKTAYTETQNIKLVIQEVSREKSNFSLIEAEKAVLEMQNAGFNIQEVSKLLEQAKLKLSENKNKEAQDLSQQIINIRNKAFGTDSLIKRISEAIKNPKKTGLLTGNVAKEITDENGNKVSVNSLLTGKTIFSGESAKNVLDMAIAAFNRGDFSTAEERAKSAQVLLLLERKGNFGLFLYLYWQFVLIGILIFSFLGIFSYKTYQKSSITKKIQDRDKEEDNIRTLVLSAQRNYFSGKISAGDYHRTMNQHQNELSKIKQERLNLRNKRIKMLKSQEIVKDLGTERVQIESEVRKLQEKFYRDRKISENEYTTDFKTLNERLAEIEGEKITLDLLKQKKNVKINSGFELKKAIVKSEKEVKNQGKARIVFFKVIGFLKSPFNYVNKIREDKRLKEEAKMKEKIKEMLG
ncbi:MAG: hypothetical protein Q7R52_01435 [archaeon]|nr:hypothetical protein [archaeon]